MRGAMAKRTVNIEKRAQNTTNKRQNNADRRSKIEKRAVF